MIHIRKKLGRSGSFSVKSGRNMGDFGIFLEKFDESFMRSGNNRVVTEVFLLRSCTTYNYNVNRPVETC